MKHTARTLVLALVARPPDGTFHPTAPVNRQQASRWFRNYNDQIQIAIDNVDPPAGTEFTATVDCPAGMRAVSGSGAVGPDADLALADSYPSETFQWTVRVALIPCETRDLSAAITTSS